MIDMAGSLTASQRFSKSRMRRNKIKTKKRKRPKSQKHQQ